MTFLAYLAEQAVVSLIDISLCALAAFLIFKGGKMRPWGVVLAVVYLLAIIGTAMTGSMHLGPIFGVFAAAIVAAAMSRRDRSSGTEAASPE